MFLNLLSLLLVDFQQLYKLYDQIQLAQSQHKGFPIIYVYLDRFHKDILNI